MTEPYLIEYYRQPGNDKFTPTSLGAYAGTLDTDALETALYKARAYYPPVDPVTYKSLQPLPSWVTDKIKVRWSACLLRSSMCIGR